MTEFVSQSQEMKNQSKTNILRLPYGSFLELASQHVQLFEFFALDDFETNLLATKSCINLIR
jgi:hypothetical protein